MDFSYFEFWNYLHRARITGEGQYPAESVRKTMDANLRWQFEHEAETALYGCD